MHILRCVSMRDLYPALEVKGWKKAFGSRIKKMRLEVKGNQLDAIPAKRRRVRVPPEVRKSSNSFP